MATLLLALFCLPASRLSAELPKTVDEYELKGAFLFKLAKFVRWPDQKFEQPTAPLVIGVRGMEAWDRFSRLLRDKTLDDHKIIVRAVDRPEDVRACHIVFLSRSIEGPLEPWTEAASDTATLTVGESPQFLEQGGMIRFSVDSGELRLEINERRTRRAGVCIMANALSTLVSKGIAKIKNL
jgi:hypothetical protein